MARILIVEDDAATAAEIAAAFQGAGHDTLHAGDGESALVMAGATAPDAVTLDRMLPGIDGLEVIAGLRRARLLMPVLMLSALSNVDERVAGLRAGGDDYLVKPFAPAELIARIEVLLRRAAQLPDRAEITIGPVTLDLIGRTALVAGAPVKLLPMEFRLLEYLMRNAGQIVTRTMLFHDVWGYRFDPGANLINVHVARLRRKIDRPGYPSLITTAKGEGYKFDVD